MLEGLRFKHRILLLVALASLALMTVTIVAILLASRGIEEVSGIETRYVPLLELNRDLESTFASITRAFEDAVSAAEESGLRKADTLRDQFLGVLESGEKTIAENGADPHALRREFRAYYALAREVSQELISGHASEELAAKAQGMRQAGQWFAVQLGVVSTPDRSTIAAAFASARSAFRGAVIVDVVVAAAAFVVMLVLSLWIVRHTARSLQAVSDGVNRLAHGDFNEEIHVTSADELGELAREANQTAVRLREYRELVEREDWVKTGAGGLVSLIAGELDAAALGRRALTYLASYVGAPVAAAYVADGRGFLTLLEGYAYDAGPDAPEGFEPGQGLIGQAARDGEIRLVSDMPAGFINVRSGLGQAPPRHILVVPFSHEGRCMGVIEIGFFEPPAPQVLEVMRRTREPLGIAFRVAESRKRVQDLVAEMQQQAEELRKAYDSLQEQNQALQKSEQRLQNQQEELQTANDHLLEAHVMLEQKAGELARASDFKSEFLASMSHELRTPLNSIILLSRILAAGDTGIPHPKQVEFAQVIFKSGEELLTLINDVLDLAKIESGKQELVYGAVALDDLATYVRQMFEPIAQQKGLGFRVDRDGNLPDDIQSDLVRLEQILKNLLSNALKFTERGHVTVRIFRPGPHDHEPAADGDASDPDFIAISVTDTGPGIAPDKHEVIFEAFAQAERGTSQKYGGTGLGLAISRQLAVRLGGEIRLESDVGLGSTFTLYLPIVEPRERPAPSSAPPLLRGRPRTTAPEPGSRTKTLQDLPPLPRDTTLSLPHPIEGLEQREPLLQGKRLLLVDDDMRHVYSLTSALQSWRLDVIAAADGLEAIEQLDRHAAVDVILMDIGMPRMDGHEAIRRIRQQARYQAVPIIALTARTTTGEREKCIEAGASEYIAKPVDLERLFSVLRDCLTAPAAPA